MVLLVKKNPNQICMLEWELVTNHIQYEIVEASEGCELKPPYLVVDGVPLDMERAQKWISEKIKGC
jgi:hypothetical protein